jgi:hypothetical protein
MALMEADRMDPVAAKNVLGAIVNRSQREKVNLGDHVSGAIYQPTIEPAQQRRLDRIMQSPEYADLTGWAERRYNGQEADPVNGATHFLAPESTMLALERQNPAKYRNWGPRGANWTGYDQATGQYKGVIMRDASHAFLAPEGAFSAPGSGTVTASPQPTQVAQAAPPPQASAGMPAAAQMPAPAPAAPAQDPYSLDSILKGLAKEPQPQLSQAPTAVAAMPELPQQMRRPVDLTRLREVLASRARLGTGAA